MSVNARKSIDSQKVFVEPIPVPIALNISLDDEDQLYYLSGDRVSHGTYKKLNEQVFKLLSGHLKDAYIVKDSNGDIILIEQDTSAARFKKYDNQITIRMRNLNCMIACVCYHRPHAGGRYLLFCLQLFLYDLESVDINCKPLLIRV